MEAVTLAAPPRVSVIVPVYRAERYVAECIASIAAQELAPHEVILVCTRDDPASAAVAMAEAARRGLPTTVVELASNDGPGAARNAGVAVATGDHIWFCDADDTADPRFLSTLARRLREDGSGYAMARTLLVRPDGTEVRIDEPLAAEGVRPGPDVAEAQMRNQLRGYVCNRLFPAHLIRRHPFAGGTAYEDFDVSLAIALDTEAVSLCAEPLYHYRIHPASISQRFSPRTLDLFEQEGRVSRILDAHPGLVRRRVRLRYRYEGVVMPVANMASPWEGSAGEEGARARRALAAAAARVRIADLLPLMLAGLPRLAVSAAVLRASPRGYAAWFRRRARTKVTPPGTPSPSRPASSPETASTRPAGRATDRRPRG
ncbi:MAG: glycosyltransferase family 2 protein [Thermoleophilia bacterium]